jgi:hypothetical protein
MWPTLAVIWLKCFVTATTLILGVFMKLRKTTEGFIMSVCPSGRPHGTTRLPPDELPWNFIFWRFFENLSRKSKFHQTLTRIMDTLHANLCIFIISRSVLLRMRNVSDKSCTENQTTSFFSINLSENRAVYEVMGKKHGRARWTTADNTVLGVKRCALHSHPLLFLSLFFAC